MNCVGFWFLIPSCQTHLGLFVNKLSEGHLQSSTPRNQTRVHYDISRHQHGILKITIHLKKKKEAWLYWMVDCVFSTSLSMSLLGPLSTTVHALGSLHWTRYVKYSSPILRTSNKPHPVPTSSSLNSSALWAMVAPHALAIRLLSVLRTRRMAVMLFLER